MVETRQSAPGQEKGSLRNILRKRAVMAETKRRRHRDGMMSFPELAKRLLVSASRSLDEIIFAGNQNLSFLLYTYYAKKRSKGSRLAAFATIIEKGGDI